MTKNVPYKFYWISVGVSLVLLLVCYLLFVNRLNDNVARLEEQLSTTGKLAASGIEEEVKNDLFFLSNLKQRIEMTNGAFLDVWQEDALRIVNQQSAVKLIEYIDSTGVIQEVIPAKANKKAVGLDVNTLAYRASDWNNTKIDSLTNFTGWVDLVQGGNVFLIDMPLFYNGTYHGTITAGMDFKSSFDKLSTYLGDYTVVIKDQKGSIFYQNNTPNEDQFSKRLVYQSNIIVNPDQDDQWLFTFTFTDPHVIKDNLQNSTYGFCLGVLLSIVIGFLLFFTLVSRHVAKESKIANFKLQKANIKLNKQQIKLAKASKAKSEFLSSMSHEIRTPLNGIFGITHLIEDEGVSEQQKDYLKLLRESTKILVKLVNDILTIDKIEAGKSVLEVEDFDPLTVVQNVADFYRIEAEQKGLNFTLTYNSTPESTIVSGDRNKFEQVLVNLVKNAIKFTDRGKIQIIYNQKIKEDSLKLKIKIKDTGIGIKKENRSLIFERFKQLESGAKRRHDGSGLGLSITRQFVELMGGKIKVKSQPEVGTVFTVKLDLAVAKTNALADINKEHETSNYSGLKVLAVDDNKLNLVILAKMLDNLGVHVHQSFDGKGAIDLIQKNNYDLVFMDVHMPGMDGFETTRQIKSLKRETVVLGLSADATQDSVQEGMRVGMSDYLTKPIDKTKLHKVLSIYTVKNS